MKARLLCAAAFVCMSVAAKAEGDEEGESFTLGQIVVTGQRAGGIAIGGTTLDQEAIEAFNRVTLADAVNLVPGVNLANSGGSRNERLIFVRGFDRFQVPLSIDGVRVYRPADNRLDFGQFLTSDVAEVQIAKGYASVLDGPGAMSGQVNLVTRKPTKALEAEVRGTLDFDRTGDDQAYNIFGLIGTRQDKWYTQVSYTRNFRDHWTLPKGFRPLAVANEDGGDRDFSRTEDWRINLKAGFTPNATDEYSISYTKQDGSKNAPLHISDTSNASVRNWSWPYSTIESFYFLSTTALSDQATLKTKLYHSSFDNLLKSWDNRNQNSQALPRAFDSPYWDAAYGGSVQLSVDLVPQNRLSIAFHYRHDEHKESQTSRPGFTTPQFEPVQVNAERSWSMAAENRYAFSDQLALTLGVSYDWRDVDRAEDYAAPPGGGLFSFPLRNSGGLNGQGRIDWTGGGSTRAHVSLASRVRFPTVFERFSSQFGTASPNPDLRAERATNAEIGASKTFGPLRVAGALFYSWLDDALVSVRLANNSNQRQNIGSADYYGGEISLDATISDTLQIGGNYGYIHRDFDVGTGPAGSFIRLFRLTDVPNHKGFAYAEWKPIGKLSLKPSIDWAGKRMTVTPATANANVPVYYKTGNYVLVNMRIDFDFARHSSIGVGVRNLFDDLYQLTDGFPEQGRSFFVTASARY
ncbi:MAG: TonB-dependent receptor [Sphingomonadales bacterium]|nr:TonB-dependent receptor [Sphingomonadales bacterium]